MMKAEPTLREAIEWWNNCKTQVITAHKHGYQHSNHFDPNVIMDLYIKEHTEPTLREAAIEYWKGLHSTQKNGLAMKYLNISCTNATEKEIESIYLKEHEIDKEPFGGTITIRPLGNGKFVANNINGDLLFTGESVEEVENWAVDHNCDIQESAKAENERLKAINGELIEALETSIQLISDNIPDVILCMSDKFPKAKQVLYNAKQNA